MKPEMYMNFSLSSCTAELERGLKGGLREGLGEWACKGLEEELMEGAMLGLCTACSMGEAKQGSTGGIMGETEWVVAREQTTVQERPLQGPRMGQEMGQKMG